MARNAPSIETGELEAKIPMSFIVISPGLGLLSQYCVMSLAKLTNETLSFRNVERTPNAAEASALQMLSWCRSFMALLGQALEQNGHRMHRGEVFFAFLPIMSGMPISHASLHLPHPMHFDSSISSSTVRC